MLIILNLGKGAREGNSLSFGILPLVVTAVLLDVENNVTSFEKDKRANLVSMEVA